MKTNYFARGTIPIGGKEIRFSKRGIQGGYAMYMPDDFYVDNNLISRYTYLFSRDKSPLSIAIKFTPVTDRESRDRKIRHYFGQEGAAAVEQLEEGVTYRELVTGGAYLSIYSLRFAVETEDGILFGCFNCSADYKDDWRETVLEILRNVEKETD